MYTLYYSTGACSLPIHALLIEAKEKFELKKIELSKGEGRTPEFLAINPRGAIPVLEEDGTIMRESAAILMYLIEKYKLPYMPAGAAARAQAIEWLCFVNATLHPAYARVFFLRRNGGTEAQLATAYKAIQRLWDEVEEVLGKQAFLAGDGLTAADLLAATIANWGIKWEFPVTIGTNTKRMCKAVASLPAFAKAIAEEGFEYKAAA